MALYAKPVRLLMKDMADELLVNGRETFSKQEALAWFARRYPKIKPGTISAHLIRLSTNAQSRTHYNAKPQEDDVFYQLSGSLFRRYRPSEDPAPIRSRSAIETEQNIPEGEDEEPTRPEVDGEFAYERDLRNYLVKNLSALESGLRLYEEEGMTGVEFPVGGRFIDILATDAKNNLVVIELKVSRGYDRVVGQLMRYLAWVKKNLTEDDQSVRGVIVARVISEDLMLACSLVDGIELYEYELSLDLKKLEIS